VPTIHEASKNEGIVKAWHVSSLIPFDVYDKKLPLIQDANGWKILQPALVRTVCKNEGIIEYESGTMEKRDG
jgi:hypothetical protein